MKLRTLNSLARRRVRLALSISLVLGLVSAQALLAVRAQPGPLDIATVRISEFMVTNLGSTGLRDENGELQDWIELHNPGQAAINLEGWSLTDSKADPERWVFPKVTLGPGQYLVVFASGQDRKPPNLSGRLHTNFKLDSVQEYLGLFNNQSPRLAVLEFAPAYPEQRNGYSFGLDSSGSWRYYATATPGAPNGASQVLGVVPPVNLSLPRGFYSEPRTLAMSSSLADVTIRYTTDGSEPTPSSGNLYRDPVPIRTTTTLKIKAFRDGYLPSTTQTHTCIFPDQVLRQPANPPGFPRAWGSWSRVDYEMDPEIVNDPAHGPSVAAALTNIPTLSVVMDVNDLFGGRGLYANPSGSGPAWERPASVEWIEPDGRHGFQINCGIRIQGGASRNPENSPKHSFRLLFKAQYGPSKLNYRLFDDSPVRDFDQLVLRAEYNLSWIHHNTIDVDQRGRALYLRDQLMRETHLAMGGAASHGRPAHLYLNGLYWGIYNPCERPNASFMASYFGGEREEYDALNSGNLVDGNFGAWNELFRVARGGLASTTAFQQFQSQLNIPRFIDYMLLNFYGGNTDWPHHNWYGGVRRGTGEGLEFFGWDAEHTFKNLNDNVTGTGTAGNHRNGPGELYQLLRQNEEFKVQFADRAHRHLFNDGALATEAMTARFQRSASQMEAVVPAESARWGDYRRDVHPRGTPAPIPLYTLSGHWQRERDRLLNTYFPRRTASMLNQLRSAGLYPTTEAPVFRQHGGWVPQGFLLHMSAPRGRIYYTLDGSDPRVPGTGAILSSAAVYETPVLINQTVLVRARTWLNGSWSALNEAVFQAGERGSPLRITEIMFDPAGGGPFEFVEIQNTGRIPLNLGGFSLEGLNFIFPPDLSLGAGEVGLLASHLSPSSFATRYPNVKVLGFFDGTLLNDGERLGIRDRSGRRITSVRYATGIGLAWAKPSGHSLEIVDPLADPHDPVNWRSSADPLGSPGKPNARRSLQPVRLNEVMAHNIQAVPHHGAFADWVELYNDGALEVNLSNWSLTDNSNPRRFVFPPDTVMAPGSFLVIWCDDRRELSGLHTGFGLDRQGETLALFDPQTNRVDAITFGDQLPDHSLSRLGEGLRWGLSVPTPGRSNQASQTAPQSSLVINEWLANAAPGEDDWVELYQRDERLPAALAGIYFETATGIHQFHGLSFIPPGGFIRLAASEQADPIQLDFRLPARGGWIKLFDRYGHLLDHIDHGVHGEGASEGRLPDGSTNIVTFTTGATPGASNVVAPEGRIKIDSARMASNGFVIRFEAPAHRACLVQFRNSLATGEWQTLQTIAAPSKATPVEVIDAQGGQGLARFYRIVIPAGAP